MFPPVPSSPSSPSTSEGTIDLATQAIRYTGPGIGVMVAGADLDGDGRQDLVTASRDAVWSVTGPLASGPIEAAGVALSDPPLLTEVQGLGDTDGDGKAELALGIQYMGAVSRSTELWAAALVSGSDPTQIATWVHDPSLLGWQGSYSYELGAPGDVNADGLADLVIADTRGLSLFHGPFPEVVSMGADEAARLTPEGGWLGQSLVAGDFDLDGVSDLAVHGGWGMDVLVVEGNLQDSAVIETIALARFQPPDEEGLHAGGAGDLDGDGATDLVLYLWEEERTVVAWGPLQGEQAVTELADGFSDLYAAPVGDLDGDGTDDLARVLPPWTGTHLVELWYGPIAGMSQEDADVVLVPEPVEGDDDPWSASLAALGDVNGDGFDDLAMGNPFGAGGTTYVLFGER